MIQDNDMIFDAESKRYSLTKDYVYNDLGTDLALVSFDEFDTNLSTLPEREIKYACDMVYDHLENNAVSRESSLYWVTKDETAHRAMKRALGYQLFDFIQKGDSSNGVGGKVSDTVNQRAIQSLLGAGVYHIVCKVEW